MREIIHVLFAQVEMGPYSEKQVRQYLAEGLLQPTDPARCNPQDEWAPVSEVLERLPPPPPAPVAPPPSDSEVAATPREEVVSPTAATVPLPEAPVSIAPDLSTPQPDKVRLLPADIVTVSYNRPRYRRTPLMVTLLNYGKKCGIYIIALLAVIIVTWLYLNWRTIEAFISHK